MKNPELRFKNDINDWQEKELQDIATINKGQQLNKTVMIENGNYYVLNGGSSPSGRTNSFNTNENTISISEGGNSCGFVNLNKEKFWSGGHNYTLNNLDDDVDFIYQILKSNQDKIMDLRVGTGIPNIQRFNLEQFKITLSKNTTIQSQIATLLSNIDTKIEIQEQKVEKLKIFKSAMLDKMFPKEGQKVPEIRFDGFSGDWEEKKIDEIALFFNGDRSNKYPSGKDFVNQGIPFINTENIHDNILNLEFNERYITHEKYNSLGGAKVKINDIIFCLRGSIGTCAINKSINNGTIASSLVVIRPIQVNAYLLNVILHSTVIYQQVQQTFNGSCAANLSAKEVGTYKIIIPKDMKEQEKISKLFEELDNKIKLETSKLNKLKDVKNAMLNKLLP